MENSEKERFWELRLVWAETLDVENPVTVAFLSSGGMTLDEVIRTFVESLKEVSPTLVAGLERQLVAIASKELDEEAFHKSMAEWDAKAAAGGRLVSVDAIPPQTTIH